MTRAASGDHARPVEATRSPSGTAGAVVALALAGSAALAFGVADLVGSGTGSAEALSTAAWLLGWVLLVWATLVGGCCAVLLAHGSASRRGPTWTAPLLLAAGAAAVVALALTHLPFGSGSGSG